MPYYRYFIGYRVRSLHAFLNKYISNSACITGTNTGAKVHPCALYTHAQVPALTCTHTHTHSIRASECWPGVLSGGNYCVRRGSIPAASCFLSPALWPLAGSLENMTGFLLAQQMACVHACVCVSARAHVLL